MNIICARRLKFLRCGKAPAYAVKYSHLSHLARKILAYLRLQDSRLAGLQQVVRSLPLRGEEFIANALDIYWIYWVTSP